jgi:hypothetical protein
VSAAVPVDEPRRPEFELRETAWIVAFKIAAVWILTLVALGVGAHALLVGKAEAPHYVALAFGALFLFVGCTPWPYRKTLLVAADSGYLYLLARDQRSCLCLPLSRLEGASVEKIRSGQGGPAWTLVLDLGSDPQDSELLTARLDQPGRLLIANGGHGQASLEACTRQLWALKEAASK